MSAWTGPWSPEGERPPWRAFVAASLGVHVAAVALAALLLVLGAPSPLLPAPRRPQPVDVSLLAPPPPLEIVAAVPAEPPPAPLVAGSTAFGEDDEARPPLQPPTRAFDPSRRSRTPVPQADRSGSGGPARTVVRYLSMSSAEAGPGGAPSATVFPETGLVSAADPAGEAPAASGDPDGTGPAGGAPGGSGALTLGPAEGPLTTVYLGSTDPRYADYLGTIAALLEPEWRDAFPRERALYMQQGEVVIEWVVERNGAISGPRVLRPSGVPPFDRNVLSGFRRAAVRFPHPPPAMPLPVRIRAPYRYRNPMFD